MGCCRNILVLPQFSWEIENMKDHNTLMNTASTHHIQVQVATLKMSSQSSGADPTLYSLRLPLKPSHFILSMDPNCTSHAKTDCIFRVVPYFCVHSSFFIKLKHSNKLKNPIASILNNYCCVYFL